MGRAPCCEKMGLKKGPWTPEEDQILVNYIRLHGHNNWRALPKQAGLLRCGKSCRLRWINYLRPDIKRGNFTQEEEETIIKLHEMLGNRWSAIAARLPGRTDNEIKNVWHTHLKKRLPNKQSEPDQAGSTTNTTTTTTATATATATTIGGPSKKRVRKPKATKKCVVPKATERKHVKCMDDPEKEEGNDDNNNNDEEDITRIKTSIKCEPVSPQPSTSEVSTITSTSASENDHFSKENVGVKDGYFGDLPEINDEFWMEVLSVEDTAMSTDDNLPSVSQGNLSNLPDVLVEEPESKVHSDEMDFFWYNLLTKSDDLPEFSGIM